MFPALVPDESHPSKLPLQKKEFIISTEEAGRRIDLVLHNRFPRMSRSQWQARISEKRVSINGLPCRSSRVLNEGDTVGYEFDEAAEPETAEDYRILFENEALLVIDKPSNLPVHPSGIYKDNTLLGLLRRDRGKDFIAHFVQRLDRETSGVLLLARASNTARELVATLKSARTIKEYLVWVEGDFPEELRAEGFIGLLPNSPVRKKMHFSESPWEGAKACITEFRNMATAQDHIGGMSLVSARLFTGRTHQIRATLCSLGYPVVGDRLYGFDESNFLRFIHDEERESDLKRLRVNRSSLHAHRLQFLWRGETLEFVSPLPRELNFQNCS